MRLCIFDHALTDTIVFGYVPRIKAGNIGPKALHATGICLALKECVRIILPTFQGYFVGVRDALPLGGGGLYANAINRTSVHVRLLAWDDSVFDT